jgi:TRAP-type C4-dicarboxylate transport system permease small subunit
VRIETWGDRVIDVYGRIKVGAQNNSANGFTTALRKLRTFSLRFHTALALVGGIWLSLTMFQVVADVTGRYLLARPLPATYAIGEIMLVFLVYMGVTYTEVIGGHTRILLISDRLPRRWQILLEIVFLFVGLPILFLFTWYSFCFALRSWKLNEVALDFDIPLYPGKFIICIGFFFLSFQYFLNLLSKLHELIGSKRNEHV